MHAGALQCASRVQSRLQLESLSHEALALVSDGPAFTAKRRNTTASPPPRMAPEDMDIGTYLEYARNKANKVPIAMRKSYKESVAKKRFSRTRYVARVRHVCLLLHIFYWADELEKL